MKENNKITSVKLDEDTILYICCPANSATGGPEALHQLGYHLNLLGFKAVMFYYSVTAGVDPVNQLYKKYNVPYVNIFEDNPSNYLLLPETHLSPLFEKDKQNIRKIIWWLSVTNYHISLHNVIKALQHKKLFKLRLALNMFDIPTINTIRKKNIIHIRHSCFSANFLKSNGINPIGKISDYMNSTFFDSYDRLIQKEDIIIYNPVKNGAFLDKIIKETPQFNWKGIKNMLPEEVAYWLNKSKVYVDFGFHPGKERMPREASIMRCCVIVGKVGSANFEEDMPINDQYKFNIDNNEIPSIIKQIQNCLENYHTNIRNFDAYRETLINEEEIFINDIKTIFTFCGQTMRN